MSAEKKLAMKILDASAVLAWLRNEKGAKCVEPMLEQASMTSVNFIELLSQLIDLEIPKSEIERLVRNLGFELIDVGTHIAWIAAELRVQTKTFGLSLGDRVCLAAGIANECPVVTADHVWTQVELPIEVITVR